MTNTETLTVMAVSEGKQFYVFCSRCGADKSSTDVSVVKELPRKYFCQHCTSVLMLDALKEGKNVWLEDMNGEFSQVQG